VYTAVSWGYSLGIGNSLGLERRAPALAHQRVLLLPRTSPWWGPHSCDKKVTSSRRTATHTAQRTARCVTHLTTSLTPSQVPSAFPRWTLSCTLRRLRQRFAAASV